MLKYILQQKSATQQPMIAAMQPGTKKSLQSFQRSRKILLGLKIFFIAAAAEFLRRIF